MACANSYSLASGNLACNLLEKLHTFFQEELWTDVNLISSDRMEMKAHKVLLASFSSYFHQALRRLGDDRSLYLEGVTGMQLQDVLSAMYTGRIALSHANIEKMEDVADRLAFDMLKEVCKKFREDNKVDEVVATSMAIEHESEYQDTLGRALGTDSLNIKLEQVDPESDNNLANIIEQTDALLFNEPTPDHYRNIITIQPESISPLEKVYSCKICAKLYPFSSILKLHLRKHNIPKVTLRHRMWKLLPRIQRNGRKCYKCPFCKQCSVLKNRILQHIMKTHFRTVKCKRCASKFWSATYLLNHMYQKHKLGFRLSRNTVCLSCGRVFRHCKLATSHIPCSESYKRNIDGGLEGTGPLVCQWCLQKFKHPKLLLRHHGFCTLRSIKNVTPSPMNEASAESALSFGSIINIIPIDETENPRHLNLEVDGPIRYLFDSGILGATSPKQLLETVLFAVNHFLVPLKSIWKNGSKLFHSQIQLGEEESVKFVAFYEGKESDGHFFLQDKPQVKLFEKRGSPYCFVQLVSAYISLLPGVYSHGSSHGFFMTPKSTWSENSWYNQANFGVRSIAKCLKRVYRYLPLDYFVDEDWPCGKISNYQQRLDLQVHPVDICGYSLVRGASPSGHSQFLLPSSAKIILPKTIIRKSAAITDTTSNFQVASMGVTQTLIPAPQNMSKLNPAVKTGGQLKVINTKPTHPLNVTCPQTLTMNPSTVFSVATVTSSQSHDPNISSFHNTSAMNVMIESEEQLKAIAAECTRQIWDKDGSTGQQSKTRIEKAKKGIAHCFSNSKSSSVGNAASSTSSRGSDVAIPDYIAQINRWIKASSFDNQKKLACVKLGIKPTDSMLDLTCAQVYFLLGHLIQNDPSFLRGSAIETKSGKSRPSLFVNLQAKLEAIQNFYNDNTRNPIDCLRNVDVRELASCKSIDIVHNSPVPDMELLNKQILGSEDPKSLAKLILYLLSSSFKMNAEELRDLKRTAVVLDKDEQGSYLCIAWNESSSYLHHKIHSSSVEERDVLKSDGRKRLVGPSLRINSSRKQEPCIIDIMEKYLCKSNSWEKTLILKPAIRWNNNTWYQQSIMGVSAINSLLTEVAAAKLGNMSKGSLISLQYAHMLEVNLKGTVLEECHKCAVFLGNATKHRQGQHAFF